MGTRQEEMQKLAKQYLEERFITNLPKILEDYKCHKELLYEQFVHILEDLRKKAEDLYTSGKKGKIQYIVISYLLSGVLTGKYDFKIDLFDEQFYLDEVELSDYWNYPYLFFCYEQDINQFEHYIRKRMIRIQKWEIQKIALQYFNDYLLLVIPLFREFVARIQKEQGFFWFSEEEDLQVSFGGYLDKGMILYGEKEQEK